MMHRKNPAISSKKKSFIKAIIFLILIVGLFLAIALSQRTQDTRQQAYSADEGIELLSDTNFSNGFGYCFWLGKDFEPGPEILRKGLCTDYKDINGKKPLVIPHSDPETTPKQENADKYWEFNEGVHDEPMIDNFRLALNHQLIRNTNANLTVKQFNPSDQALIKQVSTNKQGKIYIEYNSKNEIRNVAYNNSPAFAKDTWPTFQLSQYFRQYIQLKDYKNIFVKIDARIIKWDILPGWPYQNKANAAKPNANLNVYFFLREKENYGKGIFVGMPLFSSDPSKYEIFSGQEQLGQFFWRGDVKNYGGPLTNSFKEIEFDLNSLVDIALADSGKSHHDYLLSSFEIGIEGMGWFHVAFDIKNLSMKGVPDTTIGKPPENKVVVLKSDKNSHLGAISSTKKLQGWSLSPSNKSVVFYINGNHEKGVYLGEAPLSIPRPDVDKAMKKTGSLGFSFEIPNQYKNGKTYSLYAYEKEVKNNSTYLKLLNNSPQNFSIK